MCGGRGPRSGRLDWRSVLTLVAVVLVVGLVSLPKLRDFALQENEADAMRLMRRLETAVDRLPAEGRPTNVEELVAAMLPPERSLQDAEFLDGGRVLRRRGYLFQWTPSDRGPGSLRAWPWQWRHTGLGAFYIEPGHRALAHGNDGGLWSGLGKGPFPDHPHRDDPDPAMGRAPTAVEAAYEPEGASMDRDAAARAQGWRTFPKPQ